MTVREKVIGAATAGLLLAGVGAVVYAFVSSAQADSQSTEVVTELKAAFAPGGSRPSAGAVLVNLQLPTEANVPRFPRLAGLHLEKYTSQSVDSVEVVYLGESRASSWCFRVEYSGAEKPSVSKLKCGG